MVLPPTEVVTVPVHVLVTVPEAITIAPGDDGNVSTKAELSEILEAFGLPSVSVKLVAVLGVVLETAKL